MFKWLNPFNHKKKMAPATASDVSDQAATEEDVWNCYRLFLRRTPDKEGLEFWLNHVRYHNMTVRALTHAFLHSAELRDLAAQDNQLHLVEMPRFKINVRLTDYFIGYAIWRFKSYEPLVTRAVEQLLKPGDTFLDIGANIGYFSLMAAALVGPTGKVLAFEPNPENCHLLQASMAANGFEQIQLYPYAVADEEQTFWLEVWGANSNGRILNATERLNKEPDGFEVNSIVLDDFLPTPPTINLLKIDIEGAEYRAFWGMKRLLQQQHPLIIMEFSPRLLQVTSQVEPEICLNYLRQLGYMICVVNGQPQHTWVNMSNEAIIGRLPDPTGHIDLIAFPDPAIVKSNQATG